MRRSILLLAIAALGLTICLISLSRTSAVPSALAAGHARSGQVDNYDIRLDTGGSARGTVARFKSDAGLSEAELASRIETVNERVNALRVERPDLMIDRGLMISVPEVISADPADPKWLTSPANANAGSVLRDYVAAHSSLFGIDEREATSLTSSTADSSRIKLTFIELQQSIGGIPVFQGHVKAGLTESNEIVRIVNNLAPRFRGDAVESDFGRAEYAVASAAKYIGRTIYPSNLKPTGTSDGTVTFERNIFYGEITAEKFYFPVSFGILRPAWRVLLWERDRAFYVIVDARDGSLLWLKNLSENQTQSATYNVYGNAASLMKTADSPAPATPGCSSPLCPQPSPITRTSFTLIGNEPPYTFNNNGWITDGENRTIGNAAEAGIDRDGVPGIDPNGWAFGAPNRSFVYSYNPAPGIPSPGEEPLPGGTQPYPPTAFQQGSITNAFYVANRLHDELYLLGFNETSRNFQNDNFGRGGAGGDSISVEVQDGSFTNGANFSVTADGARPRAQFSVWTGPTPDRDGALDNQMVVHELTHGLTNRLHGNSSGLSSNMARGMGEGWSDFFSLAFLSEPSDDSLGIHAELCYASFQILPGFESNCYYGIRRFPYARRWSTGANGKSHNPFTFRYVNSDCNSLIGTTVSNPPPNSAFPRGPVGVTTCDQIHNLGEIWASLLWEVRGSLIAARGAAEGNRRCLQYIIDGMKLSPINPTMLQERDAILIAAQVLHPEDVAYVWRGFAVRGMGLNASIQNPGSGSNNTVVTESFAVPTGSLPAADFDGDGRTDMSVFRPADGIWYLLLSNSGFTGAAWGLSTDRPVPADYDGDRKADLAIFRASADASQADYFILNSSSGTVSFVSWGSPGDIPVTGDYDGDGKADPAIFRPSENRFWVRLTSTGAASLSRPMLGSTPVAGDFDGDARTDFAVFANGQWSYSRSLDNNQTGVIDLWGLADDKLVPADYDGDGKTDLAVYRPSDGVWYIKRSSGGIDYVQFGLSADVPVPGDYDGDSRADVAVYRDGVWYINRSSSGFAGSQFGLSGDLPLPKGYIP